MLLKTKPGNGVFLLPKRYFSFTLNDAPALLLWRFAMRLGVLSIVLLVTLGCAAPTSAQEPKQKEQKAEPLPPPKTPAPSTILIEPAYPQPGTREVWQYYGIDSRGRFLPRVMYHPSGSFNLQTGERYPWTTTRPTQFMPYAIP